MAGLADSDLANGEEAPAQARRWHGSSVLLTSRTPHTIRRAPLPADSTLASLMRYFPAYGQSFSDGGVLHQLCYLLHLLSHIAVMILFAVLPDTLEQPSTLVWVRLPLILLVSFLGQGRRPAILRNMLGGVIVVLSAVSGGVALAPLREKLAAGAAPFGVTEIMEVAYAGAASLAVGLIGLTAACTLRNDPEELHLWGTLARNPVSKSQTVAVESNTSRRTGIRWFISLFPHHASRGGDILGSLLTLAVHVLATIGFTILADIGNDTPFQPRDLVGGSKYIVVLGVMALSEPCMLYRNAAAVLLPVLFARSVGSSWTTEAIAKDTASIVIAWIVLLSAGCVRASWKRIGIWGKLGEWVFGPY
ncbi:hypothetical protein MKEN_01155200 [Mycena kentingensis (nom. inval.)]|nr:hypothetical protein MKEN_01155200 [Mycena kentingensis (nom. inval.)]